MHFIFLKHRVETKFSHFALRQIVKVGPFLDREFTAMKELLFFLSNGAKQKSLGSIFFEKALDYPFQPSNGI